MMARLRRILSQFGVRAAAPAPGEQSDTDLRKAIEKALLASGVKSSMVDAVFPESMTVIYCEMQTDAPWVWYSRTYSVAEDGTINLADDAQRVEPMMRYEPVGEQPVETEPENEPSEYEERELAAAKSSMAATSASGGCGCKSTGEGHPAQAQRGERSMSKAKELAAALIACGRSPFAESDAAALEAFGEARLAELIGKFQAAPQPDAQEPLTEEGWMARAPEALRSMVGRFKAAEQAHRAALITSLVKAQQEFTAEQLTSKPTEELTALGRLLRLGEPVRDYTGIAPQPLADSNESAELPDTWGLVALQKKGQNGRETGQGGSN